MASGRIANELFCQLSIRHSGKEFILQLQLQALKIGTLCVHVSAKQTVKELKAI